MAEDAIPVVFNYVRKKLEDRGFHIGEIIDAVHMAVCQAAPNFKPSIGCSFPVYAAKRAFGEIVDQCRNWNKSRHFERWRAKGMFYREVIQVDSEAWRTFIDISKSKATDPADILVDPDEDVRFLIRKAANGNEAKFIEMFYVDRMSLGDIGMEVDLSESRILQVIKRGVRNLERFISDHPDKLPGDMVHRIAILKKNGRKPALRSRVKQNESKAETAKRRRMATARRA